MHVSVISLIARPPFPWLQWTASSSAFACRALKASAQALSAAEAASADPFSSPEYPSARAAAGVKKRQLAVESDESTKQGIGI